jgi:hypothetical protein
MDISISSAICIGTSTGYGTSPEYHARMGGKVSGLTSNTSSCPTTRKKNRPMQIQSTAIESDDVPVTERDPIIEPNLAAPLYDTLNLHTRRESDRGGGYNTEQAIPSDDVTEELRSLRAAAAHDLSRGGHNLEGFQIGDEGRSGEAAAVDIRGDGAPNGEAVGASLLLTDAPSTGSSVGTREIAAYDVRPGNSGLHVE